MSHGLSEGWESHVPTSVPADEVEEEGPARGEVGGPAAVIQRLEGLPQGLGGVHSLNANQQFVSRGSGGNPKVNPNHLARKKNNAKVNSLRVLSLAKQGGSLVEVGVNGRDRILLRSHDVPREGGLDVVVIPGVRDKVPPGVPVPRAEVMVLEERARLVRSGSGGVQGSPGGGY